MFPKNLIDFLIFYKLLIIICKLCIAKHDEALISEAINRCQDQMNKLNKELDGLNMRVKNLQNIMPSLDDGSNLTAIADPLQKLVTDLKDVSQQLEK